MLQFLASNFFSNHISSFKLESILEAESILIGSNQTCQLYILWFCD